VASRSEDRGSLFLLLSLLFYIVVGTFLEDDLIAEGFLMLSLYGTLLAATIYLSAGKGRHWPGTVLAIALGLLTSVLLFYRLRVLMPVFWALLAAFCGFVAARLFGHLGRPGAVTAGRLYVAVSLYLLLAVFWFALYNLLEAVHPGSFGQPGQTGQILPRTLLYFSLETLTTLGFGDILPLSSKARSLVVFEAVAGVLYIAVTVSRLVAGYRSMEE
jgi:hypothetical protein